MSQCRFTVQTTVIKQRLSCIHFPRQGYWLDLRFPELGLTRACHRGHGHRGAGPASSLQPFQWAGHPLTSCSSGPFLALCHLLTPTPPSPPSVYPSGAQVSWPEWQQQCGRAPPPGEALSTAAGHGPVALFSICHPGRRLWRVLRPGRWYGEGTVTRKTGPCANCVALGWGSLLALGQRALPASLVSGPGSRHPCSHTCPSLSAHKTAAHAVSAAGSGVGRAWFQPRDNQTVKYYECSETWS